VPLYPEVIEQAYLLFQLNLIPDNKQSIMGNYSYIIICATVFSTLKWAAESHQSTELK
jgi:hypothetical protein